jgi:hypothetical protein
MAEAIVRSLAVNTARGQLRSQQVLTKMLSETEQARGLQKMQRLETALNYKLNLELELDRRKELGITGPEPIPHPDDVRVDVRTGEVSIIGLGLSARHEQGLRKNNRAENSHQPVRPRERNAAPTPHFRQSASPHRHLLSEAMSLDRKNLPCPEWSSVPASQLASLRRRLRRRTRPRPAKNVESSVSVVSSGTAGAA